MLRCPRAKYKRRMSSKSHKNKLKIVVTCFDESLHSMLKEKSYAEKMNKMQAGDLAEFEQCFTFASDQVTYPSEIN